jgi:formylglycine-generating enzyme required for sulfatase activity
MVLIPKGPFLYGDKKEPVIINYNYYMDIYPVTNAQYKEFIKANGYGLQKFWSEEGWAWKQENHVNRPDYWNVSKWNKADHPVVGVTYYEAEAYASWTDKRLPTEQEWEKAARGTDGRQYPWGKVFDENKCNSEKSGIDATTPVTKYGKGSSPSGCYDMAGNVWEWCASWYDQSDGLRVIRGGSWDNFPEDVRTLLRYRYSAVYRNDDIGFRLAQDAP